MTETKRIEDILLLLDKNYPNTECYLNHDNELQLLIATMLSAQCTDERVNKITPKLFEQYKTVEDYANADIIELQELIFSTGSYRNKSKNIIASCNMLIDNFNKQLPATIEELTKLPGVGRKTANVILGHIFNIPSIVVDTHVKRISLKLGLTKDTNPDKIEFDLMKILPKEHWIRFNTQIIAHGRTICKAKSANCKDCFLNKFCQKKM